MTDYEYIQRLKLLGNNDICDIHNIERLKPYHTIEAVSKIKGININNVVRFIMAYESNCRNVGNFIKNMQIACKLFGSDIITKMLSDWHMERDNGIYLTYDCDLYGKVQTFGKNCRIALEDYDEGTYTIRLKGSTIKGVYEVDINSTLNSIGLLRSYNKYHEKNVEMHIRDDGSLECIGALDNDEYWARYSGNDTLSICLQ